MNLIGHRMEGQFFLQRLMHLIRDTYGRYLYREIKHLGASLPNRVSTGMPSGVQMGRRSWLLVDLGSLHAGVVWR